MYIDVEGSGESKEEKGVRDEREEDRADTLCKDKEGATQRFRQTDFKLNTWMGDSKM